MLSKDGLLKTEELHLATIEGLLAIGSRYVILTVRASASAPPHRAGQFTQLEFEDSLGRFRKFYSIASAPRVDRRFDLCLLLDDPRLKQWIFEQRLGDTVGFTTPSGRFFIPPLDQPTVLVAGGSGVTPLRAMLEDRLSAAASAPCDLLFGCQSDLEIPFYAELLALEARFPSRAKIHFFADELKSDRERARLGRPIDELPKFLGPEKVYLLCGPPAFMNAAQKVLQDAGIDPSRIHQDRF